MPFPAAMCVVGCESPSQPLSEVAVHTVVADFVQVPPRFVQASSTPRQYVPLSAHATLAIEHVPFASHFSCVSSAASEHDPARPGPWMRQYADATSRAGLGNRCVLVRVNRGARRRRAGRDREDDGSFDGHISLVGAAL